MFSHVVYTNLSFKLRTQTLLTYVPTRKVLDHVKNLTAALHDESVMFCNTRFAATPTGDTADVRRKPTASEEFQAALKCYSSQRIATTIELLDGAERHGYDTDK